MWCLAGDLVRCSIVEADDGTTAIAAMETAAKPFDCVFLDSVMVDMHGPEAARKMRSELEYRGPIISVTGNSLPEDIDFLLWTSCSPNPPPRLSCSRPCGSSKSFSSIFYWKWCKSPYLIFCLQRILLSYFI